LQDAFDWLVKQGANLDVTNQAGETPRLLAARSQDPFKSLRRSNPDSDFTTAIRSGNLEALRRLVKALPQMVNESNQYRQTPLRLAVLLHRSDMLEVLETNGAKSLIQAGAQVNLTDGQGFTALHWAVMQGATESAAWLLSHRAAVNQPVLRLDSEPGFVPGPRSALIGGRFPTAGETPLHLAVYCGQTNLVKLLLKSGADANALDANRQTPLDLADQQLILPALDSRMENGMRLLLEPLGVSQLPPPATSGRREQNAVAAQLIKAAGGKHSERLPEMNGMPPR
jgi:ankyrin repeat protein